MLRRLASKIRRELRLADVRAQRDRSRGYFRVEFDGREIGFFAQLNACLHMIRYAESKNLKPDIRLISRNYGDVARGENWLSFFFDILADEDGEAASVSERRSPIKIYDVGEMGFDFTDDLTLHQAHDLFFRHYRVKDDIAADVDAFCAARNVGREALGVHFRGTDKSTEAPRVDYADAIAVVQDRLSANPSLRTLFVASDEQRFVDACHAHFAGIAVVSLDDSKRSDGFDPLHIGGASSANYAIGRDALLNSLVLSRCATLIRTTSFLSAWSSIFNPDIEVILLNAPFAGVTWFPEREIMKTATIAGGPRR